MIKWIAKYKSELIIAIIISVILPFILFYIYDKSKSEEELFLKYKEYSSNLVLDTCILDKVIRSKTKDSISLRLKFLIVFKNISNQTCSPIIKGIAVANTDKDVFRNMILNGELSDYKKGLNVNNIKPYSSDTLDADIVINEEEIEHFGFHYYLLYKNDYGGYYDRYIKFMGTLLIMYDSSYNKMLDFCLFTRPSVIIADPYTYSPKEIETINLKKEKVDAKYKKKDSVSINIIY